MSKITISKELRLTPTLKAVIEGGIKHIKKGHVQHAFMRDEETNIIYDNGWQENGKKPQVCAVGGLQRAAWIAAGKPDMSIRENIDAIEELVDTAINRIQLFLPVNDEFVSQDDYEVALSEVESAKQAQKDGEEVFPEELEPRYYISPYDIYTYTDLIEFNDGPIELVNIDTGKKLPDPKKRVLAAFEAALGIEKKPKKK